MKTTGLLQVIFGGLSGGAAFLLSTKRSELLESAGGSQNAGTTSPDATLELLLLVLGIMIVVCAFWQLKTHIGHAAWQIIFGFVVTLAGAFFSIRDASSGYLNLPNLNNLLYLPLIAGIAVFLVGFFQLKQR